MIHRIRIGFVALALVLLATLGLLLSRTLEGLARERESRHNAVAARVFDEAERRLSGFLQEEEARPAEQYRAVLASGAASPLAGPPGRDFVRGYFELGSDGGIRSPRVDASSEFLAELGSILPGPREAKELVDRDAAPEAPFARGLGEAGEGKSAQEPGTTRVLQKVGVIGRVEVEAEEQLPRADLEAKKSVPSSYNVLDRLNLAARSRRETRSEAGRYDEPIAASERPAEPETRAFGERQGEPEIQAFRDRPASADAKLEAAAKRDQAARVVEEMVEADDLAQTEAFLELAEDSRLAAAPAPASLGTPPPTLPPARARLRRLELGPSPLAGARVGPERLVLYRTAAVSDEDGPVHQGLLVDTSRLSAWLRSEVLGKGGLLDSLELEFGPGRGAPADRFVYEHRFGEPFGTVSARLLVTPLPDEGGSRYVYGMGLLLVLASTAGLFAVYRRVAVAVHFAERRSNFAAAVSHELKTPLTAIRMYAEMLRDGMVGEEAKRQEYYGTITAESERLTRLIDNVLEFSKLENQRRELSAVTAPVDQALRDVVRVVEPHALALGFTLKLEIEPGLPPVPHDPDALQQILFNLVDNALKYARDAERPEVTVSARTIDDGIAVRVRDHGPGVDPAHLPHVFDAFYRGESELTRRTQGTGIGLALVHGLVGQMGGRVSARNHPDGGLELELRLPR